MTRLRQPKALFHDRREEAAYEKLAASPDSILKLLRRSRRTQENTRTSADAKDSSSIFVYRQGSKLIAEFEVDDLRDLLDADNFNETRD
jgi:hypothetical protein